MNPVRNFAFRNGISDISNGVKLIIGLISGEKELFERIKALMSRRFGPVDCASDVLIFDHTDYYRDEFGEDLLRVFFSFRRLVSPEKVYRLKALTNRLESGFLNPGKKRRINIDPGYLTLASLVLFTTKNFSHRIYLEKGIYAENTLCYKNGTYNPWQWTFPDYRTGPYIEFFNKVRDIYRAQLSKKRC